MTDRKRSAASLRDFDRNLPPQDRDAELIVVGSVLLLPECLDEIAFLRPGDFWDNRLGAIFGRLQAMHQKSKRIDPVLLAHALEAAGEWTTDNGDSADAPNRGLIGECMNSVVTAAHALEYAEIVHRHAIARDLIHAGEQVICLGHNRSHEAADLLNNSEELLFSVRERRASARESQQTVGEAIQAAMAAIDARQKGDFVGGIGTGFRDLDKTISLRNGELIILAARPSMGKTALATNIAANNACDGVPTLFASLEMSSEQIAERMLSSFARVDSHRMQNGTLSHEDRQRIIEASAKFNDLPLIVDDSPSSSVLEIAAAARRMKRKQGLGLIVVDYLQLVSPEDRRTPRQEQVATIAGRLKMLARELKVPVLCLAQLNRQAESTSDAKPRLSHLRESGAIEQDADVVMFVHRDEYYHPNKAEFKGKAEVIVAKNRNGPTGSVELVWRAEFTTFASLARDMF